MSNVDKDIEQLHDAMVEEDKWRAVMAEKEKWRAAIKDANKAYSDCQEQLARTRGRGARDRLRRRREELAEQRLDRRRARAEELKAGGATDDETELLLAELADEQLRMSARLEQEVARLDETAAAEAEAKRVTYPCKHCTKHFESPAYLEAHVARRHPETLPPAAPAEPAAADDGGATTKGGKKSRRKRTKRRAIGGKKSRKRFRKRITIKGGKRKRRRTRRRR